MSKPSTPKIQGLYRIDACTHLDFKEICRREGVSMTEKHEEWERLYVHYHKEGNPQMLIESFLPEKAEAMVLCGSLDGSKKGEVHCTYKDMWIPATQCYNCPKNRLKKK